MSVVTGTSQAKCVGCGVVFDHGWVGRMPRFCTDCRRRDVGRHGKRYGQRRASELLARYGLTVQRYSEMEQEQHGRCAVCGCVPGDITHYGRPEVLHVDHNHETGRVRALLCSQCNRAIGQMSESPERLRAAADYLEFHAVVGDPSCR